jgi:hypothetical protein
VHPVCFQKSGHMKRHGNVWSQPGGTETFASLKSNGANLYSLQRCTVADEDALSREMARVQEGHDGVVSGSGEVDVARVVGDGPGGRAAAAHGEAGSGVSRARAGGRAARRRRRHGGRIPEVRTRVRVGPRPISE